MLSFLPPDFFSSPEPQGDSNVLKPNMVALSLALCGWQGLPDARIGSVSNSISCRTCLRRLGLWMFKSKELDESGRVKVPAPMEHLDTVREHRFFCPWRNPSTQAPPAVSSDVEPPASGWSLLVQTLKNESHLRTAYGDGQGAKINGAAMPIDSAAASTEAEDVDEEDQKAKDKERWARLKKIKSLFDIKGGKGRSRSRPGTSHSTQSTADKRP